MMGCAGLAVPHALQARSFEPVPPLAFLFVHAVKALSLVDMTVVAERTITDDLEYLISQTVDPSKADYAGVAGAGGSCGEWSEWRLCWQDCGAAPGKAPHHRAHPAPVCRPVSPAPPPLPPLAAVVTGVQIHNWGAKFDDPSPNLEYVAPTRCAGQARWLAGLACHFLWHYCRLQDHASWP